MMIASSFLRTTFVRVNLKAGFWFTYGGRVYFDQHIRAWWRHRQLAS